MTGDLPGDTPSSADSASATPDQQAASTEVSPAQSASETGAPAEQPTQGMKPATADRFQELLADRAAQKTRAETAEQALRDLQSPRDTPDRSAASSTANATDSAPQQKDFDDYEKYIGALSRYEARQEHVKLRASDAREQQVKAHFSAFTKVTAEASARLKQAESDDPNFAAKLDPRLLDIQPASLLGPDDKIDARNVIADDILRSEHTADLLQYFSAHPDEFDRLGALPDPYLLQRELGRLEAGFTAKAAGSTPTTDPQSLVSRAPTPPVTLGRRTVADTDPVDSALARGDEAAYIREANRREARELEAG
jgi:hypothetical protein